MAAPLYCEISGFVYQGSLDDNNVAVVAPNADLWITPVSISGTLLWSAGYKAPADSSGEIAFKAVRGATINIRGDVLGWTATAGVNVVVPSAATATLESLTSVATVPTTGLTVQDEGVALTSLIGTFNFVGTGVTVTQSPAGVALVTITAGGGSGTVTSVGLALPGIFTVSGSPVSTTGTLTGTLATQLANLVWAGPVSGGAAAPAFRSLVAGDLPATVPLTNAANIFAALQTVNPGTTPSDALLIDIAQPVSDELRDSHNLVMRGTSKAGATLHNYDWRQFVDAQIGGQSTWTLQSRIDAASYATRFSISDTGNLDLAGNLVTTGLTVNGGAGNISLNTTGTVVLGNVSSAFIQLSEVLLNQWHIGSADLTIDTTGKVLLGDPGFGNNTRLEIKDTGLYAKLGGDAAVITIGDIDLTTTSAVFETDVVNQTFSFRNGILIAGTGPTTLTDSAGKILSNAHVGGTLGTAAFTAATAYAASGAITGSGLTMATARLLGRSTASTGAVEEITVGSGLSLSAGTLSASGGSGATTALDNLAAVAINTDLLPASTQSLGSATKPFLSSFTGNTTQYESVVQTAGVITHAGLGSATNIGFTFTPKGTGQSIFNSDIKIVGGGTAILSSAGQSLRILGSGGSWDKPISASQFRADKFAGGTTGFLFTSAETTITSGIFEVAAKVIGAGDATTANAGWFTDAGIKRVVTQFDKTSSAALANVTGLSATVTAGRTYSFEAILYTASGASGGVQFAIAGTATATAIIYEAEVTSGGAINTIGTARATALATKVGDVTAVMVARCRITGTITVNAGGTLTVQFAQNVSDGTASSVLVGSSLVLRDNP